MIKRNLVSAVITRNREKKIYNTIIKVTLLYGSETWRMTKAEKRKLLALEMDAYALR